MSNQLSTFSKARTWEAILADCHVRIAGESSGANIERRRRKDFGNMEREEDIESAVTHCKEERLVIPNSTLRVHGTLHVISNRKRHVRLRLGDGHLSRLLFIRVPTVIFFRSGYQPLQCKGHNQAVFTKSLFTVMASPKLLPLSASSRSPRLLAIFNRKLGF